jgi:hypothetical protein
MNTINTSFDVRTDAGGKDPDTNSATLRRYHRLLWSKPLQNGVIFDLIERGAYLHHESPLGKFVLSSDSVIQTFTRWTSMQHITSQFTKQENEEFMTIAYTIGAMMVFPANRINGMQTINGARGFNRAIADRLDLTLECIRRYYLDQASPLTKTPDQDTPLAKVLARYTDFFRLFDDFRGYVDFFLLQDLVTSDYQSVEFFMPFDNFKPPATPRDVDTYRQFRHRSIAFIKARNKRISQVTNANR